MAIATASQLLYSKSAACRMFGDVQSVKVFDRSIWVHVAGKRPQFVSKKQFKEHFVQWRKAQAKALTVTVDITDGRFFTIWNETRERRHHVQIGDAIHCTCEDFKNQQQLFYGRACCKHSYAVLAHLGFGSLSQFLATRSRAVVRERGRAVAA